MAFGMRQSGWGSEEEEDPAPLGAAKLAPAPPRASQPAAARRASRQTNSADQPAAAPIKLPSLQGLCLSVLGDYLGELLECAEEVLPLLPGQYRACLLGVARRRGLLDDRALAVLADEEWTCLDCHGAPLTEPALRQALAGMPALRQADLSGCPVGPATLRLLGESCPQLEVLRIGGSPATDSASGCAGALRRLLPQLEKAQHADVECWEALAEQVEGTELAAPSGRLMRLRCLVWPGMPFELEKHCRANFPLLAVNPSSEDVAKQGLPADCDSATSLDAALFTGLADPGRWESRGRGEEEAPLLPIAERFRLAYVEQAQRLRERAERAERRRAQQRRREIRRSPAEMAIRQWLNES